MRPTVWKGIGPWTRAALRVEARFSPRYEGEAGSKQVIALAFTLRETVVSPELDLIRATA